MILKFIYRLFTAILLISSVQGAEAERTEQKNNGPTFHPANHVESADSQKASDDSHRQHDRALTVATWNIQVGSDFPPFGNGWKERKLALIQALEVLTPDILCTQEGRLEQLQFIDKSFPDWNRVGGGRDDGKNAGEFCAIYFNRNRLACEQSGTFWLSSTPDSAKNTWDPPYKRICTHALFRDNTTHTKFVVLSTHFPLNPTASTKAARVILTKLSMLYKNMPILLCGDFNCEPDSEAWQVFEKSSLQPVDESHQMTWHNQGKAVACLDAIFRRGKIKILESTVFKQKYNNTYPSDHFPVLVKALIQ